MPGRKIVNKGTTYETEGTLDNKGYLCLTDDLIQAFLEDLLVIGCTRETVSGYRRSLEKLRGSLDEDKALDSAAHSE